VIRVVRILAGLLLLAALDGALGLLVGWKALRLDPLMLYVILVGLYTGPRMGTWLGWLGGLLRDLAWPELLGLQALAWSLVGFAAGRMASEVDRDRFVVQVVLLALLGLAGHLLVLGLLWLFPQEPPARVVLGDTLTGDLVGAILAPTLLRLARRWSLGRRGRF
jgi:rod shape-determining protein MreD